MKALIFALMVAAGCGEGEGEDESAAPTPFERLRDHLIDLRLADAKHVDQAAHRIAMKLANTTSERVREGRSRVR